MSALLRFSLHCYRDFIQSQLFRDWTYNNNNNNRVYIFCGWHIKCYNAYLILFSVLMQNRIAVECYGGKMEPLLIYVFGQWHCLKAGCIENSMVLLMKAIFFA